ncbi:MAG: hypothetical protein AAF493_03075 [Pseudomonadota bacterium]
MERDTETFESTNDEVLQDADDFEELLADGAEEAPTEVRLADSAVRRNLSARRRIEQIREQQRLRDELDELDDWD